MEWITVVEPGTDYYIAYLHSYDNSSCSLVSSEKMASKL
jgi:hypothetical protein